MLYLVLCFILCCGLSCSLLYLFLFFILYCALSCTLVYLAELGEKDDGNFAMWKTTYDNDFTEIDEIER